VQAQRASVRRCVAHRQIKQRKLRPHCDSFSKGRLCKGPLLLREAKVQAIAVIASGKAFASFLIKININFKQ
jgi:hypothetical protein